LSAPPATIRSATMSFFVLILLSLAFLAVGVVIAFYPHTYSRWLRRSRAEHYLRYLPSTFREFDVFSWRFRIVGIWLALFGLIFAAATVWICWIQ
jgi:hypothetical protein